MSKTYKVTVIQTETAIIEVEADNRCRAIEKVNDDISIMGFRPDKEKLSLSVET